MLFLNSIEYASDTLTFQPVKSAYQYLFPSSVPLPVTASMAGTHQAAVLPRKGGPLSVENRITPERSANEVLIEVKAIAVNPGGDVVFDYEASDVVSPSIYEPHIVPSRDPCSRHWTCSERLKAMTLLRSPMPLLYSLGLQRSRELRSSLFCRLWRQRNETTMCSSASTSGPQMGWKRALLFRVQGFRSRLEV